MYTEFYYSSAIIFIITGEQWRRNAASLLLQETVAPQR
jgi:hypothetical protein